MVLVQRLVAVVLFLVSCIAAQYSRSFMYQRPAAPFSDTGFSFLPNWSAHGESASPTVAKKFLLGYSALYALGVVAVVVSMLGPLRWIVLRRVALVTALGQLITIATQAVTRMPDPDPSWRTGAYFMFPVLFSAGWMYLGMYLRVWNAGSFGTFAVSLTSLLGVLLTIACHVVYTVDVVCMILNTAAIFLLLEWFGRSPESIAQRNAVFRWFEADAAQAVSAGRPLWRALFSSSAEERADGRATTVDLLPLDLPVMRNPQSLGQESEDDGSRRLTMDDAEMSLVWHVHRHMREGVKLGYSVLSALCMGCMAVFVCTLCVTAADIGNGFRPLGRPPMPDVLFDVFNDVGIDIPHTAANTALYLSVAIYVLDAVILQPMPLTAARRSVAIYTICFFMRFYTVVSTFVTDPYPACKSRDHPDVITCGDSIYSGHAITFMSLAYGMLVFRPSRLLQVVVISVCAVLMLVVVAARLHYTRDVLTALVFFTVVRVLLDAMVFRRPDRVAQFESLFSFECDYYVARERVVFGYPVRDTLPDVRHDYGSTSVGLTATDHSGRAGESQFRAAQSMRFEAVDAHAPRSLCEQLRWKHIARMVRPTSQQSSAFRAWLRAPKTEPLNAASS